MPFPYGISPGLIAVSGQKAHSLTHRTGLVIIGQRCMASVLWVATVSFPLCPVCRSVLSFNHYFTLSHMGQQTHFITHTHLRAGEGMTDKVAMPVAENS